MVGNVAFKNLSYRRHCL